MKDDDLKPDARIRERARHLWEADGSPEGREDDYFEQARELIAIEDNPHGAKEPHPAESGSAPQTPVEPIEAVENQGEFPTLTDQGEETTAPKPRDE